MLTCWRATVRNLTGMQRLRVKPFSWWRWAAGGVTCRGVGAAGFTFHQQPGLWSSLQCHRRDEMRHLAVRAREPEHGSLPVGVFPRVSCCAVVTPSRRFQCRSFCYFKGCPVPAVNGTTDTLRQVNTQLLHQPLHTCVCGLGQEQQPFAGVSVWFGLVFYITAGL